MNWATNWRVTPTPHPLDHHPGVERPLERPIGQQLDKGFRRFGQQRRQYLPGFISPTRFGDMTHNHPVDYLLDVLPRSSPPQHLQRPVAVWPPPAGMRGL